jgi:hypothetical protein
MITTTLNEIRAHSPCANGWRKLLVGIGKTAADDEPLPLVTVLDINGLGDTLWCLRALPDLSPLWRLYAVWCARRVQHLMTDPRSLAALDVAERHARGLATDDELAAAAAAAMAAARAAAWGAAAAWDAAGDAAWGAAAARAAAMAAAWGAAAAWDAARAAARAAAAARDAARDAARATQAAKLRQILTAGEWVEEAQ